MIRVKLITPFFSTLIWKKSAILIVYVDDIIMTGNNNEGIQNLKLVLAREIEIKDLDPLRYFFGMKVARSSKGIVVTQRKYMIDLLKEVGMLGNKPANVSTNVNHKIGLKKERKPVEVARYQKLMGKLIYLSHIRLNITSSTSMVSQFMHSSKEGYTNTLVLKKNTRKGNSFKRGG